MDSNPGALLTCFAHRKLRLLNGVAQCALTASSFHPCKAKRCSHRTGGIAKSTNTNRATFRKERLVDFSNQSCAPLQFPNVFSLQLDLHSPRKQRSDDTRSHKTQPRWGSCFTVLFTSDVFFTSFVDPTCSDTCNGFNSQLCWNRGSAAFPWS